VNPIQAVVDSAVMEGLATAARAGVPAFVAEFVDTNVFGCPAFPHIL